MLRSLLAALLLSGAAQADSQVHIGVGVTVVRSTRVSVEVGKTLRVRCGGRGEMAVQSESGVMVVPASGEVNLPAPRNGYVVVTVLG